MTVVLSIDPGSQDFVCALIGLRLGSADTRNHLCRFVSRGRNRLLQENKVGTLDTPTTNSKSTGKQTANSTVARRGDCGAALWFVG